MLARRDEVCHQRDSQLSPEQADRVKEGRECQHRLWFRKSASKNSLQDDRGNQADECKRLTHSHKKLRPIKVRCRPRARVLGIQNRRGRHAREADRQQQPGIKPVEKKKTSDDGNRKLRSRSPEDCWSNLVGFKTVNRQCLRHEDNGSQQAEAEESQAKTKNRSVPLPKVGQIDERIWASQPPYERGEQENSRSAKESVEKPRPPPVQPLALV